MNYPSSSHPRAPRGALLVSIAIAVAALGGCASGPPISAEWRAPDIGARAGLLKGDVLVACEVPDVAIRNLCQDQLAAQLTARGGRPILPAPETQVSSDQSVDGQLVAGARNTGARAILIVTLRPVATAAEGPSLSFGLGGFGFGRGSGGGGGIGATVPVGEQRIATGFSANGRVTDVSSGRLVWTASTAAPPSQDLRAEFTDLSKAVLDSAARAGLI